MSFYQDLIWNRISSAGKKTTHDGVQTSVNYSIVGYNGYKTGSGSYWSGVQTYHTSCWFREATATDVVNASMANTSVSNTTGVYYSVSYANDDTRKIWVDTTKVADIFTMMYNQISK